MTLNMDAHAEAEAGCGGVGGRALLLSLTVMIEWLLTSNL